MQTKSKVKKPGTVKKIIKPIHPEEPEKVEITIEGADHLYKEIRIDNTLKDAQGHQVKLKEHAEVDVIVEADPKETVPDTKGGHSATSRSHTGVD